MSTLRELEAAATPAPWVDHHPPGDAWIGSPFDGPISAYRATGSMGGIAVVAKALDDPDAALIAAARNALPLLLDVVDAARAFMGDEGAWDRWTKGDPGPALKAALAALDSEPLP